MKRFLSLLATVSLVGSPALADMVAASPGVTLTQAAQAKFNHDSSQDDRYIAPTSGSSAIPAPLYTSTGLSPTDGWTLEQVAAAKFDQEGQDQGALSSRSAETTVGLAYGTDRNYAQLAAAAGLSGEEAAEMSFDEIANAKLNAEH
jgi:hypothetical protein